MKYQGHTLINSDRTGDYTSRKLFGMIIRGGMAYKVGQVGRDGVFRSESRG